MTWFCLVYICTYPLPTHTYLISSFFFFFFQSKLLNQPGCAVVKLAWVIFHLYLIVSVLSELSTFIFVSSKGNVWCYMTINIRVPETYFKFHTHTLTFILYLLNIYVCHLSSCLWNFQMYFPKLLAQHTKRFCSNSELHIDQSIQLRKATNLIPCPRVLLFYPPRIWSF